MSSGVGGTGGGGGAPTLELETLLVRLNGDGSSYLRMLEEAKRATELAAAELKALTGAFTASASSITNLAGAFTTAFAAIGSGFAVMSDFGKFDEAMTQSTAIMNVTTEQIEAMKKASMDLASQGPISADKYAKAFYFLTSAGLNAEQSIAALPAISRFAQSGLMQLSTATSLANDAQTSLGMRSADAAQNLENLTRITDVLTRVSKVSNATIEQFSYALSNRAGAAAKSYGKDVEETAAVLAAFADQGVKGRVAGTFFQRLTTLLAQTSREQENMQKNLGFKVFDEGKMRNYADIIGDLELITKGMSAETKSATLDALGFKARIQAVILPLIGSSEAIRRYEAILRKAGGTTKEISEKQLQAFNNQLRIMWNNVSLVAIELGARLAPAVLLVVNAITDGLRWFRALDDTTKSIIFGVSSLVSVLAGIGPSIFVVQTLTPVFASLLYPILTALRIFRALALVSSPIVIAFAVLSLAVVELVKRLGGLEKIWADLNEVWANNDEIANLFNDLLEFLQPVTDSIKDLLGSIWAQMILKSKQALDFIIYLIDGTRNVVNQILASMGLSAIDVWKFIRNSFVMAIRIMTIVIDEFDTIINSLWKTIKSGGEVAIGAVTTMFNYAVESGQTAIATISVFMTENWKLTKTILAAVGAFFIMRTAVVLTSAVLTTLAGVLVQLRIVQMAFTVAVAAWQAVAITTQAVVYAFLIGFHSLEIAIMAARAAWMFTVTGWSLGAAIMTAAMTTMGTVMAASVLIPISMIATTVGAMVYGALTSLSMLVGFLGTVGDMLKVTHVADLGQGRFKVIGVTDPIKDVTAVFQEWGTILKDVWEGFDVDSKTAMDLMKAGFSLAILQIRDMWPPLWTLIKEGFLAVTDLVVTNFQASMLYAIVTVKRELYLTSALAQIKARETMEATKRTAAALADARIRAAASEFKWEESAGTKAAREEVARLTEVLKQKKEAKEDESDIAKRNFKEAELLEADPAAIANATKEAEKAGEQIGGALTKGVKSEMSKVEQAIFGSAEAFTRIANYMTTYAATPEIPFKAIRDVKNFDAVETGSPAGQDKTDKVVDVLKEIRDNTAKKDEFNIKLNPVRGGEAP